MASSTPTTGTGINIDWAQLQKADEAEKARMKQQIDDTIDSVTAATKPLFGQAAYSMTGMMIDPVVKPLKGLADGLNDVFPGIGDDMSRSVDRSAQTL